VVPSNCDLFLHLGKGITEKTPAKTQPVWMFFLKECSQLQSVFAVVLNDYAFIYFRLLNSGSWIVPTSCDYCRTAEVSKFKSFPLD
jgi:hypothetical protein